MKTKSHIVANVYVDGMNLYHRALRDTIYKWLDLRALSIRLLYPYRSAPRRIHYFTAPVIGPEKQRRQEVYFRALGTIPALKIHRGRFQSNRTWMPLANPWPGGPTHIEVVKREEKGSDANLAAWLTRDAAIRDCQAAFVISGDSDFAGVIRMVRREFNFPVYVIDPRKKTKENFSRDLRQAVGKSKYRHLDRKLLPLCQFPSVVTDRGGRTITKPREWN